MDTEDGQFFIKSLAQFVRTHEKALANALQLRRQSTTRHSASGSSGNCVVPGSPTVTNATATSSITTSGTLAAALSLPYLTFASHNIKPAKLALTPHHLFYLLSKFEDLGIVVGPMNVRLENLHAESSAANYVSFLNQSQRPKSGRGSDHESVHSVSSVRSVMSGMSSLWANFGLGSTSSATKTEKQKAAIEADLKYLYASFTKIPCLRLAPDRRARLIQGFEEFPFDTAVPLLVFKNISALEISDIDIRQFYGWDRMADQLRSLTVKRAGVDEPDDLIINIVLDDMDKRRRRSARAQMSPITTVSPKRSPIISQVELAESNSEPGSPIDPNHIEIGSQTQLESIAWSGSVGSTFQTKGRQRSYSPVRPASSRAGSTYVSHQFRDPHKIKRSGSASSQSTVSDCWNIPRSSSYNLSTATMLPSTKWRFLKHLSLADNNITSLSMSCLLPLANTLHSLDLSSNHFSEVPGCLAYLTALRALNLSNCMIDSLHSLTKNPLPAITALNLRSNRLISLAGIERLYPLERIDLRDNKLTDPTELARLTGIPDVREIWVSGNPFTRTHSNSYRVTIFNLFRRASGYTEDIVIDTYAPGYSERRQLVERIPEKFNVPVVKPPPDYGLAPILVNKPIIEYPTSNDSSKFQNERPRPVAVSGEVHTSSLRRKRTQKRRIIDLSISEAPTSLSSDLPKNVTITSTNESDSGYGVSSPDISPRKTPPHPSLEARKPRSQKDVPRINASLHPHMPPIESVTIPTSEIKKEGKKESQDWKTSGEEYKKKIDIIRNEVGNDWLTVISENNWDAPDSQEAFRGSEFSRPCIERTIPTTSGQNTILHGRTLG
ncbi:hypothetical protein K3495_g2612 [Podosphaera aphanis]|nr:hypothetical protein K3495_g2612 [Podosphaera aphanis]